MIIPKMELSKYDGNFPKKRFPGSKASSRRYLESIGAIRRRKSSLCSKCRRPRTADTGHQWYQSVAYQGRRGGSHVFCPNNDGDFEQWKIKWDQTDADKIEDSSKSENNLLNNDRPSMVVVNTNSNPLFPELLFSRKENTL